jgi:hypothetical protein
MKEKSEKTRMRPIFNYIVSSLSCRLLAGALWESFPLRLFFFDFVFCATKNLQSVDSFRSLFGVSSGLLFVIIYISALSMFSHTFIGFSKMFAFHSVRFCHFLVMGFSDADSEKQVHSHEPKLSHLLAPMPTSPPGTAGWKESYRASLGRWQKFLRQ